MDRLSILHQKLEMCLCHESRLQSKISLSMDMECDSQLHTLLKREKKWWMPESLLSVIKLIKKQKQYSDILNSKPEGWCILMRYDLFIEWLSKKHETCTSTLLRMFQISKKKICSKLSETIWIHSFLNDSIDHQWLFLWLQRYNRKNQTKKSVWFFLYKN